MSLPLRPRGLTALFVLLSAGDLALTCYLLRGSDGQVYEANWLAQGVLGRYGFTGLAVFKGLMVLLVSTLVAIVAAYRPVAARRLATFACAAVGVVVVYSLTLCARLEANPVAVAHQGRTTPLKWRAAAPPVRVLATAQSPKAVAD